MPINASHEYFEAEKRYLQADSLEEKIVALEELIRKSPSHKGAENLRAELKTRLKKFREKLEKGKKTGKGKKGIRKEGYQCVLIGKTNSGKSALMNVLTNAEPEVSEVPFTTKEEFVGMMDYDGVKAQIIELPAIEGKDFDYNIVNTADCLLIVVEKIDEIPEIEGKIPKAAGKKIYVFGKVDVFDEAEKRKLEQQIRAKRIRDYVLVSAFSKDGVDELKRMIFDLMDVVRVYTKEPGKVMNKDPVVLKKGAIVEDVAETIYKGFSKNVKEARLTGPSAKFSNQRVGMKHRVKDMDVVEFSAK